MIQEIYQEAMKFAGEKHCDQKIPGSSANYLLHVSNVVMEVLMAHQAKPDFDIQLTVQIAALHDTIEDTDTTFSEIGDRFGEKVANAVQALTKNESLPTKREKMIDSLTRINQLSKEVGIVKIADRITNLQPPPSTWASEKAEKYLEEARIISKQLKGKNEYLDHRLQLKIVEYRSYM